MNTGVDGESSRSLHDLLSALCDGVASPEQMDRIEDLLRREPAARRFYLRYMDLHAAHDATSGFAASALRGSGARMTHDECRNPNVETLRHSSSVIHHSSNRAERWPFIGTRLLGARVWVAVSALALLLLVGIFAVLYWHPARNENQLEYPPAGRGIVASPPSRREPPRGYAAGSRGTPRTRPGTRQF